MFKYGDQGAKSGSGNVVGPASSINNDVVLFNGTSGKLIKDSGMIGTSANTASTFVLRDAARHILADLISDGINTEIDLVNGIFSKLGATNPLINLPGAYLQGPTGAASLNWDTRKLFNLTPAEVADWGSSSFKITHRDTGGTYGLTLINDDTVAGYINAISFKTSTFGTNRINVDTAGAENSGIELNGGSDYTQGAALQLGGNNANSGSIAITPGTPFGGFYLYDSTFSIFIFGTSNDFIYAGVPFQMTQVSTPISFPGGSGNNLYFKSDNKLYGQDFTGTEYLIGPNSASAAITGKQILAGTTTFTFPVGTVATSQFKFTVIGGGGGGAGGDASHSGGGAGGGAGTATKWLTGMTAANNVNVVCGGGGAGGSGSAAGTNGNNTTVASGTQIIVTITGNGGGGGNGSGGTVYSQGGTGGGANNGDITAAGCPGGLGIFLSLGTGFGGNGGASSIAGGGIGGTNTNGGGGDGSLGGIGAGGGGGGASVGIRNGTGGTGGNGVVVVEWTL